MLRRLIAGDWLFFLDHGKTVAAFIIGYFVHDVVDEQNAAAGCFEEILRVERIGNFSDVKSIAFVFDSKADLFGRDIGGDAHQLFGIETISVFDSIYKGFVERNKEVRVFVIGDADLFHALHQVIENVVHQRDRARHFELYFFAQVLYGLNFVDKISLVI